MKYSTIYADPPWDIKAGSTIGDYVLKDGKQVFGRRDSKARDLAYPTMTVEEISALLVKDIADKNAHLYIWVTNSHLPFVFDVIKAWGFKYSTTLVWAKTPMGGGLGGAFKISTEYLIFARRGKLSTKKMTIGTWFNEKRPYFNGYPKHSAKPEFFRKLIMETSPGPYLEMFAREQSEGWDLFGNEVENSIIL